MSKDWVFENYFEPGWDKGMAVGLEQGKAEGKAEGKTEGRVEEARSSICSVLHRRFGQIPAGFEAELAKVSSLSVLHQLLDLALDAVSMDAFEARFEPS